MSAISPKLQDLIDSLMHHDISEDNFLQLIQLETADNPELHEQVMSTTLPLAKKGLFSIDVCRQLATQWNINLEVHDQQDATTHYKPIAASEDQTTMLHRHTSTKRKKDDSHTTIIRPKIDIDLANYKPKDNASIISDVVENTLVPPPNQDSELPSQASHNETDVETIETFVPPAPPPDYLNSYNDKTPQDSSSGMSSIPATPVLSQDDIATHVRNTAEVPNDPTFMRAPLSADSLDMQIDATQAKPHHLSATQQAATEKANAFFTQQAVDGRQLQPGDVIKGRFVLESMLGKGGMGEVYKARDLRKEEARDRNPYVAIKVLGASFKDHPQSLIALQREARKAQTLAHPNIVTVFDFDRDGDTVYMTMEYLEGNSLDRILRQTYPQLMDKEKAMDIIQGICEGLAYAHKRNIIHSDLKPGNVYVTNSGEVKVFDFGIARAMKPATDATGEQTLFDAGSLGGLTPAYASLEMLHGEEPDVRDDIYALACIAYELLGGRHPFNKTPADRALNQKQSVELITQASRRENKALQKGLAFERDARTSTVNDFLADISGHHTSAKTYTIAAVVAAVLLIAIAAGPLRQLLQQNQINDYVEQLMSQDDSVVQNALTQISNENEELKVSVFNQAKDALLLHFAQKVDAAFNPAQNRLRYQDAAKDAQVIRSLFPDSAQVANLTRRLEDRKNQLLNTLTQQFNQHLAQGKLLPSPQDDIEDVLETVRRVDPQHALLKDPRLVLAYGEHARRATDQREFTQAQALASAGLSNFPDDVSLINLVDQIRIQQENYEAGNIPGRIAVDSTSQLTVAQRQQHVEAMLAKPFSQSSWSKEISSHINTLAKSLPTEDLWLKEKRVLLAKMHFDQAGSMAQRKRYTEALTLLARVPDFNKSHPGLNEAKKTITQEKQTFETQQRQQAKEAKIKGLKQTLITQADANDINGAKSTFSQLREVLDKQDAFLSGEGANALGGAYARLAEDLAKNKQFQPAFDKVETGLSFAPDHKPLLSLKKQLQEKLAAANAKQISAANDPCKPSFAGYGSRTKATCADTLTDNQQGPTLVVIPSGGAFAKPFAIGKYEVSIGEFNIYCRSSRNCEPRTTEDDSLPVTEISLDDAKAFTQWLSKATGYTYRLPTSSEWKYAAKSDGKQPAKDFNCRVLLGDRVVKGNSLLSITSGKRNAWGLANYIGNAQEWAIDSNNSDIKALGGTFEDPLNTCDVNLTRKHNGSADALTGFRVLREMS